MENFNDLVGALIELISMVIPLLFAITILVITWGIFKAWILNAGEEQSLEEGRRLALAGVIALVVMTGVWGILRLLHNSLF